MRVLLTGANGFVGSQLVSALRAAGHEVLACVRDPIAFQRRFPTVPAFRTDFNDLTVPKDWQPLLRKVDAVINCAGVMNEGAGQSMMAVHYHAPTSLFVACQREGIKKVIQVSAVSVAAQTDFAETKRKADDALMAMDLDWTILRPSLIYARGAYGGTAVIRGLAASPIAIPMPGDGQFAFQPIHISDFSKCVITALEDNRYSKKVLSPCGPDTLSLGDMTKLYRAWLGIVPAPSISIPMNVVRLAGRFGDWMRLSPVTSNIVAQLEFGNAANYVEFSSTTGIQPRSMGHMLEAEPAGTGDLWQARGWWLQILARLTLILYWGWFGLVGLNQLRLDEQNLLVAFNISPSTAHSIVLGATIVNFLIVIMLAIGRWPVAAFRLQLLSMMTYVASILYLMPFFWFDRFGALPLTVCLMSLVVVHRVLCEER